MTTCWTIVHTEGSRRWGGQEARVLDECRWMKERGHRVLIFGPAESVMAGKAAAAGLERRHVPFRKWTLLSDLVRLRRLLCELRPQILNTHGNLDSKIAQLAAAGLGIPLVIRSRHAIPPVKPTLLNRLLYGRLCRLVLTTGECSARQLIRDLHLPAEHVVPVPSGIRVPRVLPDRDSARRHVEGGCGIPSGAPVVGYVGRLQRGKGVSDLVASFEQMRRTLTGAHLVLVGDGPDRGALEHQARELGVFQAIHFVGYQDDPWPYFRAFDAFVLATPEHEGVSQALRQAMFAGCPVVATDIGGNPEVVRHGDTGLLVPPSDPVRLAEALVRLLGDRREAATRAARARAFVESSHTLDHMGERLLELYRRHLPA